MLAAVIVYNVRFNWLTLAAIVFAVGIVAAVVVVSVAAQNFVLSQMFVNALKQISLQKTYLVIPY